MLVLAQQVQLRGRVFNTEKRAEGIPGVRVLVKSTGHVDRETLTGRDGKYELAGVVSGKVDITFAKKPWQPEPLSMESVELKPGVVELNADLFQPPANLAAIQVIATNKAALINAETAKGSNWAKLIFTSEWQSCESAKISVRNRVACAQILTKQVDSSLARPPSSEIWANVGSDKIDTLESTWNYTALRNSDPDKFTMLKRTGIPATIVFEHTKFELDKANASEQEKKLVESKAKAGLGLP